MLGGIIIDELYLFQRMQLEDAALHEFGIQDAAYVFLSIFLLLLVVNILSVFWQVWHIHSMDKGANQIWSNDEMRWDEDMPRQWSI